MAAKKDQPDFSSTLKQGAPVKVSSGQGSARGQTRRLTLDLDPDAHRAFRMKASELDTTMKQMLNTFVEALAEGDEHAQQIALRAEGIRR